MKYYKDNSGAVFAYAADGSQDAFIPCSLTLISELEADTLRAPAPTPGQAKAQKWEAIKRERDKRRSGGVKVGGKWFHSDDASRIQQLALVMMGSSIPSGLKWKTMDGSFVDMTQTLAQQIFTAQATSDQTIFSVAESHRVAMEASAEPSEYDFSTGWSAVFAE